MSTYRKDYIDLFVKSCKYTTFPSIDESRIRKYFELLSQKREDDMHVALEVTPLEVTSLMDAHFLFQEGVQYGHMLTAKESV